ncbi:MAG: hypothetical protein J0652_13410, partial [Desulfobulbaceae bacterium]|nr:hypothetical protein [Desulfobulbaceae bacterium]
MNQLDSLIGTSPHVKEVISMMKTSNIDNNPVFHSQKISSHESKYDKFSQNRALINPLPLFPPGAV